MYIRKTVLDFTPPVLLKLIKYIRRFQKTYKSYDEALKVCSNSFGYEDPVLINVLVEETKEYLLSLNKNYFILDDQTTIHTLIPFSFIPQTEILDVVDVGGGCGMHYFPIRKMLGDNVKFNWHVVETNALSKAAKVLENGEIKFFNNVNSAVKNLKKIDLIISAGAIQYFEDPRKILRDMVNLGADYILLTRLSLSLSDCDIISVQKSLLSQNGFEILPDGYIDKKVKYPHTNIKEFDFKQIIEAKYKVKLYLNDKSGVQYINNYPSVGYGLLLEKNKLP